MRAEVGGGAAFTAPAGSPGLVRSVADGLYALASRAESLAPGVRRGREAAVESWTGDAADAFAAYGASLAALADGPATPLRTIGQLLGRYADALEVAQRSVEAAALVTPEVVGHREAGLAWRSYASECAAIAGELQAIAAQVAAVTERSRVAEVLSSGSSGGQNLSGAQWQAVQMALLDLQGLRGNALGWVGFTRYYEKGAGSLIEQGRRWAASDDIWRMTQEAVEGSNWGKLVSGGLAADEMSPVVARMAEGADVVGRALGPIGLGLGIGKTALEFRDRNYDRGTYNVITTTLGAFAALPPPVGLACGTAAIALGAVELLYDNVPQVQTFVDAGVEAVTDAAEDIGDAASESWDALTGIF